MNNKNITAVINLIRCLEIESLKNPEVVANLVRAFGIVCWGSPVFGEDEIFKNRHEDMAGIYQTPDQIAKALVYLSQFKINSYCEIGIFQGGNFVFVSEYLKRFNPEIKCIGIDPTNYLNPEIKAIIEQSGFMSFVPETSEAIKDFVFDLVFLDGDHTAEWINQDYSNVGKKAKICMFHDIQESSCPDIVEFWENIKKTLPKKKVSVEFTEQKSTAPLQGIGIIHDRGAK